MPIKQLQLRGMSNSPSDRATADGGCSESINVFLDKNETAPALPPEDVSSDIYREALDAYPIHYIHKMTGVENYIGYDGVNIRAYGSTLPAQGDAMGTVPIAQMKSITSIGNTLIAFGSEKTFYFLFENGAYKFLGTEIPVPQIEVISRPGTNGGNEYTRYFYSEIDDSGPNGYLRATKSPSVWVAAINPSVATHTSLLETMKTLWDNVSVESAGMRKRGAFNAPFFIRYAVRLYDGRYIHLSAPMLCGAANNADWLSVKIVTVNGANKLRFDFNNLFTVWAKMEEYNVGNWKDIVKSIDFFASEPIYAPAMGSDLVDVTDNHELIFKGMTASERDRTIEETVLSRAQFYFVHSFETDNLEYTHVLYKGYMFTPSVDDYGDNLYTKKELEDAYRDGIQYIPINGCETVNNRLIMSGAKELLPRMSNFLNGEMSDITGNATRNANYHTFIFRFRIKNPVTGEGRYVFGKQYGNAASNRYSPGFFVSDQNDLDPAQYFDGETGYPFASGSMHHNARPYSWITYPDTRCDEVEIYFYEYGTFNGGKRIPMKRHPFLECSYAFFGYGVELWNLLYDDDYEDISSAATTESRELSSPNKIFQSEMDNPFLFPAGGIITFTDEVIGLALTSVPLSEGQVGDFDVYVFTGGGIRVLRTAADGTFSSQYAPTNLARYVALPGTIQAIEQAVVFITDKGVMMLTGGEVRDLSPNMVGMPYMIDSGSATAIGGSPWASFLTCMYDDTTREETFVSFMKKAKMAYDHKGARLIFFGKNPNDVDCVYQYVYMLNTGTWHKVMTLEPQVVPMRILNSYPECLVSIRDTRLPRNHVYQYSTVIDDASVLSDTQHPVKGIIITRPFDLDEPDVRKAIRSIRIRGKFNRDDVKYILLGSFDGLSWKRLTSLRGGSYKLFRMILLCNLTPLERISWIDIDYETRFTNRLR